jgi:MYXO-CTERM domain-containing protein
MRRLRLLSATALAVASSSAMVAQAAPLLQMSGKVAAIGGVLPDDVTVKLEVDLDRNDKFSNFERLVGRVEEDGSYQLTYGVDPEELTLDDLEFAAFVAGVLADYEARGFDALIDQGPLPVVVTFEREGYSTVVGRLSTMIDDPNFDVVLTRLQDVQCTSDGCESATGNLRVSGFPGGTGIDRAYAEAYDPSQDGTRFPGGFFEPEGSLLISSGFMEVDFRDSEGERVKRVSSPVEVNFEADPNSWSTLRDLEPDTDRIEVPMWSFDESSGHWVAEDDGALLDEAGEPLGESELPAILDGSYEGKVFIGFSTEHFSSWNCDRPITTHTCVKGRLVAEADGSSVAGASVTVEGVSYNGWVGTFITGTDGYFVADVMKSEQPDEDVDRNSETGEEFTARVVANMGAMGTFMGTPFATSTEQLTMGRLGRPQCQPDECDCPDLGDISVEFELPRLCEVSVEVTFSGESSEGTYDGPLEAGEPMAEVSVQGTLQGGLAVPAAATLALCADKPCGGATADAEGKATLYVPVIGDTPVIDLSVSHRMADDDDLHYYTASAAVEGCTADESALSGTIELQARHRTMTGLEKFIASLGDGPRVDNDDSPTLVSTANEAADDANREIEKATTCDCRSGPRTGGTSSAALAAVLALGLALARRRRHRGSGA